METENEEKVTISSDAAGKNSTTENQSTSHNPFLSPTTSHGDQFDTTGGSTSFYPSIFHQRFTSFSVYSPSDCSYDDDFTTAIATDNRLNQDSFIVEYQQLYNSYTLCLGKLQDSVKQVDALRQQNETLGLINTDLVQRLSVLSQATIQNCIISSVRPSPSLFEDFSDGSSLRGLAPRVAGGGAGVSGISRMSAMETNRINRRNVQRDSMPKSISVRSKGYVKATQRDGGSNMPETSNNAPSQNRTTSSSLDESQRVYVPSGKKTEEALEFEVYNQGTSKTELCNKWQESGACPYGDNCHFAHGISELRPVIRHPRYKTQVCRMVLAGNICPYGHRCHFRHSITDQDRMNPL